MNGCLTDWVWPGGPEINAAPSESCFIVHPAQPPPPPPELSPPPIIETIGMDRQTLLVTFNDNSTY